MVRTARELRGGAPAWRADLTAALHAALPVSLVPALHVGVDGSSLSCAGVVVPRTGADAEDALELAHRCRTGGERWPGAVPSAGRGVAAVAPLVRVHRSGAAWVAFGAAELLGVPPLVADPSVQPSAVRAMLRSEHHTLRRLADAADGESAALSSAAFLIRAVRCPVGVRLESAALRRPDGRAQRGAAAGDAGAASGRDGAGRGGVV